MGVPGEGRGSAPALSPESAWPWMPHNHTSPDTCTAQSTLDPGARCRPDKLQGAQTSPGVWEGTGSARRPHRAERKRTHRVGWGRGRGRLPGQPPVRPDGQPSAVPSSSSAPRPGAASELAERGSAMCCLAGHAGQAGWGLPLAERRWTHSLARQACWAPLPWARLSPRKAGTSVLEGSEALRERTPSSIQPLIHSLNTKHLLSVGHQRYDSKQASICWTPIMRQLLF